MTAPEPEILFSDSQAGIAFNAMLHVMLVDPDTF